MKNKILDVNVLKTEKDAEELIKKGFDKNTGKFHRKESDTDKFKLSNYIKKDKGSKLFGDICESRVKEFIEIINRDLLEDWKRNNSKTFTLYEIRAIINFRAGDLK